jgi:starvation-inducible DNA-binding protein
MAIQTSHEGRLFETRNDIDRETRIAVVEALNQTLADTTDLMTQVKHAHWNVKGPQFQPLHELFDDQAAMLADHADVVAERATALGGHAMGTARMAADDSRLPEYPAEAIDGMDCVEALADRFALHGEQLRAGIEMAGDAGDEDTVDLYVDLSRDVDKQLWFLESHLQGDGAVEETGVTAAGHD